MGPDKAPHPAFHSPENKEVVNLAERKCEVSDNAWQQLEAWGINELHIDALADLAAKYEYNNVEAQAKGIVERGVFLDENEQGELVVILPDFFDLEGDRRTGQCSELAFKTLRDMVNDGWLDDVNEARRAAGQAPIERHLAKGKSPYYFAQHYWLTLHPQGDEADSVIVDSSFQKVLLQSESDYAQRRVWGEGNDFYQPRHEVLRVGKITQDESGNWEMGEFDYTLVGMSPDYSLGVDICFGVNAEGRIQPVVIAYDNSNTFTASCTRLNGHFSWRDAGNIMDDARRADLERVLGMLENMQIHHDPTAFKRYKDDDYNNPQEIDLSDMSRAAQP